MKLIVGLGNPGKKYERTRHNVGFLVADAFSKAIDDPRTIILKPDTYMNRSGEAVREAMRFRKIPLKNLLVISDDADLPFGEVRVREQGSSGGHQGLQSIIDALGTDAFTRVRVGIGRPDHPNIPLEDWVLGTWTAEEEKNLPDIIKRAVSQLYGRNDHV